MSFFKVQGEWYTGIMQILLAVIVDLFQFARTSLFGSFFVKNKFDEQYIYTETEFSPQLSLLPEVTQSRIYTSSFVEQLPALFVQGEEYFIGAQEALVYIDPVIAFDTVCMKLPYSEQVHMQKLGGRWAYIKTPHVEGWVLKDFLAEKALDVFPQFVANMTYDEENIQTHKLRLCIADIFVGEATKSILTDVEYVTYMLKRKGITITWPVDRPRIAGTWQKKLRGAKGIHIGVFPKTDSVMEYVQDDVGHVCYVEAVFPDQSIKISSIGTFGEGLFSENMLQKDEWKELRPVFIEVV